VDSYCRLLAGRRSIPYELSIMALGCFGAGTSFQMHVEGSGDQQSQVTLLRPQPWTGLLRQHVTSSRYVKWFKLVVLLRPIVSNQRHQWTSTVTVLV
jgi:hypothetical protein